MKIQENQSRGASNQYSLTSFGHIPGMPQQQMLIKEIQSRSNDNLNFEPGHIKSPPYIGLRGKEIPISGQSTIESRQVKEIYS